jgi:P4 family phage/plasmid primase-like protien
MANRKKNIEFNEEDDKESASERRARIIDVIERSHTFLTLRNTEELLYFDPHDGQWHEGTTFLNEFVRKEAGSDYTTNLFREIKAAVMVDTYIDPDKFKSPAEWINLKNGALNVLKTEFIRRDPEPDFTKMEDEVRQLKAEMQKKLKGVKDTPGTEESDRVKESIRKDYNSRIGTNMAEITKKEQEWRKTQKEKFAKFYFTSTLPVSFDPSATCPRIDAFFRKLEIGDEMILKIHELFGYCLYKSYPFKKMFIFEGPNDTGKGAVASLLEALLGENNYSALSLDAIQDDKYEKKKLKGMYANISGELASKFIKDTSLIKELLGSDSISVREMYSQKNVKFRNHAKLIFLANQIPATYDTDEAFYPKVEMFEFRKQFPEGSPDRIEHDDLMAELATDQELSGLLNKVVKAFQGLKKRGKFTANRSAEKNKEIYLIRSNPFKYYFEEALEFGEGEKLIKSEAYANFVFFCQQYNVPFISDSTFYTQLKHYLNERGIVQKRDDGGKGQRYYPGVSVKKFWGGMDSS